MLRFFRHHQSDRTGDLRTLRRECESRLAELGLPDRISIFELREHLSLRRARPIHLIPMRLGVSHPCGLWVAARDEDFIAYEADTSRPHQEHIVAHEFAHMICCHRGTGGLDDASARLLFPDVDPQLVRDMLRRHGYSDREEQEAEMMASLLLEWGRRGDDEFTGNLAGETAAIVARINRTVGHPWALRAQQSKGGRLPQNPND